MIVKATPNDYMEVREVWGKSVKATHDFLPDDYYQKIWDIFFDFIPSVELYVNRNEQGTIDGFVGVADGKMEMLFLHPGSIGKGIGTQLAIFAIEQLKVTKVDVNEHNVQATAFYKKMGFEIIGRSETDGLGKPFPILSMVLRDIEN